MSDMRDMFDVATEINGVLFYLGPTFDEGNGDKRVVFTEDENYHIDTDEDIQTACQRIYDYYYAKSQPVFEA